MNIDILVILLSFVLGFALATTRYIGGYRVVKRLKSENVKLKEALAQYGEKWAEREGEIPKNA